MIPSGREMASRQGATPPAWLGRSRWSLLGDVLWRGLPWRTRLVQAAQVVSAWLRPGVVRGRLERLRALGHVEVVPSTPQILVAARDQMFLGAVLETRQFYASQGIPWSFHNLRRFLAGPATLLDPMGLYSPRETIVDHVLQTFHRHPHYDLVLLRAYEGGIEELERQARALEEGSHPATAALRSLIEDGSYHARLLREIEAFKANPHLPARPIPAGLVQDPRLMMAMDQFKDLSGFARYARRLRVGRRQAAGAWIRAGWNELFGGLWWWGPRGVEVEAVDPEIRARWSGFNAP